MFVAVLSLTMIISLTRSSSVISMPVCIALSVPQEGIRSASASAWSSSKHSSPAACARNASIITGILMTLAATTGTSAPRANVSPVARFFTYTPVSPPSASSCGVIKAPNSGIFIACFERRLGTASPNPS